MLLLELQNCILGLEHGLSYQYENKIGNVSPNFIRRTVKSQFPRIQAANLNHEGHEEHEGIRERPLNSVLRALRVLRGDHHFLLLRLAL